MNRELIYNVLKLALTEGAGSVAVPCGETDNGHAVTDVWAYVEQCFVKIPAADWDWAFSVLSMHGLAAFAYSAVEKMPQNVRPAKDVLLKFIAADMTSQREYAKLTALVGKMEDVIRQSEIKCLLLKGLSLADYYPKPYTRRFVDIDLYAPGNEDAVDEVFKSRGVAVDNEFYRHSHFKLSGVLVENHKCLLDIRGRDALVELDADLKSMAEKHLSDDKQPGLHYPDAMFSAIFNLHHAMSHFIYEGISFKFLVDWILFLRNEKGLLTTDQMADSLRKHNLVKFAAMMSLFSVHHLGLKMDEVPEYLHAEMSAITSRVEGRFEDDLFRPYEKVHQKSLVAERIGNVRRIIKSAWKPKEFLGQSAVGFVWDKFLPILLGKKYEAD